MKKRKDLGESGRMRGEGVHTYMRSSHTQLNIIGAILALTLVMVMLWVWETYSAEQTVPALRNAAAATRFRERMTQTPDPVGLQPPTQPNVAAVNAADDAAPRDMQLVQRPAGDASAVLGVTEADAQGIVDALDATALLLRPVELVIYNGVACYEFVLDHGTLYIRQSDGTVQYNGIAVIRAAQALAAGTGSESANALPMLPADGVNGGTAAGVVVSAMTPTSVAVSPTP
jgi:hypothetical protein